VGKATAALVPPGAMLPVVQAPVSELAVCLGPVLFVQVTVEPTVIRIGFGLKHQGAAPEQSTIRAGALAALAARGTSSNPGRAIAMARKTFRTD